MRHVKKIGEMYHYEDHNDNFYYQITKWTETDVRKEINGKYIYYPSRRYQIIIISGSFGLKTFEERSVIDEGSKKVPYLRAVLLGFRK